MRLWSLHPSCLDAKGLVALWREALLAKAVILGKTRGYRNHPQLRRFYAAADPEGAINCYLSVVLREAVRRGYRFDASKVDPARITPVPVTRGQIEYEKNHLLTKLAVRDPSRMESLRNSESLPVNDVFYVIEGGIEDWEKLPMDRG